MRSDVHSAALRAAAKVTFSVAVLSGCSTTEEGANSNASAVNAENKPVCEDSLAKVCGAVFKAAYPTPGDYQIEPVPQPPAVIACCDHEMALHGANSTYRWDCCVAKDNSTDAGTPDQYRYGMACTPWGPPVPPSMARSVGRRPNPEITAWLAQAAA